jgi:hypothetical protein
MSAHEWEQMFLYEQPYLIHHPIVHWARAKIICVGSAAKGYRIATYYIYLLCAKRTPLLYVFCDGWLRRPIKCIAYMHISTDEYYLFDDVRMCFISG